ncbi:transglycosylase domain-containing protein [Qipengyuania sphaerica]|uniref:transglycosylase domain-containing protein n=1 Tax=Qipengyuania sphaerica TaxID=2867243 RepID=UPI001C882559|nr:transglycosylase domain-containing protein [Qipengyuania sphaerica]MBX7541042.1 transglycosylase domain-containing protein [Qipengyuania sphaerica]
MKAEFQAALRHRGAQARDWWLDRAWPFLRDRPLKYTIAGAALVLLLLWEIASIPPWSAGERKQQESLTFLASDGSIIARRGPAPVEEVDAAALPPHVRNAFIAIEDRRFEDHGGIDLRGLARAMLANAKAGGVVEGGSTITQQYVKNTYLTQDRTFTRKFKEFLLADWVENWMDKDEILSRYLETAYFGGGQTGLTAAAHHFFDKKPDELTLGEAAMLAGVIKAPSNLAPTVDREASLERMEVVLSAMVDGQFITRAEADEADDPRVDKGKSSEVAAGSWFTDWLLRDMDEDDTGEVQTTLDADMQEAAQKAIDRARLGGAEAALIAIRPDGRVLAMVGGKKWEPEAYNRALFAQRQPGSTFKLYDYLAAFRDGATPDDTMLDAPLDIEGWKPKNGYEGYYGVVSIREAFAWSSNTVAVRAAQAAGYDEVRDAARDLGVHSDLPEAHSLPLGTANMTLAELVTSYAAFAGGSYPVKLYGIEDDFEKPDKKLERHAEWAAMLDLLWYAANYGTGKRAALDVPTFGKTGTTQDGRDAIFVGFAGNVVTAVWIGRDDNKPVAGASGGRLPAQIWEDFMSNIELEPMALPFIAAGRPAEIRSAQPVTQRIAERRSEPRSRGRDKRKRKRRGPHHTQY